MNLLKLLYCEFSVKNEKGFEWFEEQRECYHKYSMLLCYIMHNI